MPSWQQHVLTDLASQVWVDAFEVQGRDAFSAASWSMRKTTLSGGVRDRVELVEVDNGLFRFSVLPTRGMGIWRGSFRGVELGWQAPIHGPVHPRQVNLLDRGGLGWLDGFDEWICRCGLSSNGPPGEDPVTKEFLPLHGRIANLPAHRLELRIGQESPQPLAVFGEVDETTLFFTHLRLRTTISTCAGTNWIALEDEIENRGTKPAELEILYHCNFGPPVLGEGSRVVAPIRQLWPRNERAAEGMDAFDRFLGPTPGFVEQVYFYDLLADVSHQTLALLHNARADLGVSLRMDRRQLPRFIVWKNTAALEDGYVAGLEPATNYPNPRWVERERGRVIVLAPKERYRTKLLIEVWEGGQAVAARNHEIAALQAQAAPLVNRLARSDQP